MHLRAKQYRYMHRALWQPGHYNPSNALVVRTRHGRRNLLISSGDRDTVLCYRIVGSGLIVVVSYYAPLGYVGCAVYDPESEPEMVDNWAIVRPYHECVLQTDYVVEEHIGDLYRLSDTTIARRITALAMETHP